MRTLALAAFLAGPALAQEADFEVLVLGTYHAPAMFYSDAYTPAHIRAALIAAEPDVVGVESHPTWFAHGRYHVVTYEAQGVAVPFARERGLVAAGVDWKDVVAWDADEELDALDEAARLQALPPEAAWPRRVFGEGQRWPLEPIDWRHINSAEFGASRHVGLDPEDPDFGGGRDRGIAANCVELMRAHPGQRLVVVIGAHHKPFLEVLFGRVEGVRVLHMGRDVPWPDGEAVEAAWTADDLVTTLGWRLDGQATYFGDHEEAWLAGIERLLALLDSDGSRPAEARYMRARWHAAGGRRDAAAKLLDALLAEGAEEADGELYPFPMRWWRMRHDLAEAAALERARLLLEPTAADGGGRGKPGGETEIRARAEALLGPLARAAARRLRDLERTRPREVRLRAVVKDPGFERGAAAADIFDGWATYIPTGHGRLAWAAEEQDVLEGPRALAVTIEEANPQQYGFHVRQECRAPRSDRGRRIEFECGVRSEGLTRLELEVHPPYSSSDRTPLAVAALEPYAPQWRRFRVAFDLPEAGRFALYVRFDGPVGARLLLDDGTPLVSEFVTVPREWSRAALAAEFPHSLLAVPARAVTPAGGPAPGELDDAGFEAGALADTPRAGWFHSPGPDEIEASSDAARNVEGQRALRVTVVAPRPEGQGRAGLFQIVDGVAGEHEFAVRVAADGGGEVLLVAGTWERESVFRPLARTSVALDPEGWVTAALAFDVPPSAGHVGLFLYLPEVAGRSVWFDDARLEAR